MSACSIANCEQIRASADKQREQLCEAHFFIAERYLMAGDVKRAADHYEKTVSQGVTEYLEHGLAMRRLAALRKRS